MSTDAATSMSFLDAVAAVLDGHPGSVLDPLPPEQREFAEEILRKFETRRAGSGPTDLGL